MRRGDEFNLRWEKVDFQRNVIYVPNSKTGKDYSVPMNEDVRNTLLQLRNQSNPSEYVFVNPETNKPYTDLKKAFGTACRLAGIRGLHWHDLRHTFGTRLAEAVAVRRQLLRLWAIPIRKQRAVIHTPPIGLNKRRWRLCAYCVVVSATTLPQRKNGCRKRQP